jgi:hypothetical protein
MKVKIKTGGPCRVDSKIWIDDKEITTEDGFHIQNIKFEVDINKAPTLTFVCLPDEVELEYDGEVEIKK